VEEVAYQHWHRMLFSRFLAENGLLMYPEGTTYVAVTLDECEDLAQEEGATNGWELASRFAARMLPQIFRPDSPVFRLVLPPEHQHRLERLVADLPVEVFLASDSLGWVYQFWQAKRKEEVNRSEVKIGALELPAVTQLFTEPYMVSFLLDNALGAWWAGRVLSDSDLRHATSEEELRQKASIPGVPLEYLRFFSSAKSLSMAGDGTSGEGGGGQGAAVWCPAAGTFDGWPKSLSALKVLDPCCGSGHFLVATLLMLVPIRMRMEGLSAQDAVDAVLEQNLHGLELDQRCVELAAFALALAAWKYPGAGGYRPLPELNVACSGLAVTASKERWEATAPEGTALRDALGWMHGVFKDAPVLGSLLNPKRPGNLERLSFLSGYSKVSWGDLSASVQQALAQEQTEERTENAVVAQGLAKAATLLTKQYDWVVTNVPYLARGKQADLLRQHCDTHFPEAKNELATVFLDRCLLFCKQGGTVSVVLPQNWLFLTSYRKFREKLLRSDTWHLIARLGAGAFETISGEVVKAILITLSHGNTAGHQGGLFGHQMGEDHLLRGLDVSEPRTAAEKAAQLRTAELRSVKQAKQLENPDARVAFGGEDDLPLLSPYADGLVGLQTSDDPMFIVAFWEVASRNGDIWELMQGTPDVLGECAGQSWMVRWERGEGLLLSLPTAYPTKGLKAVGKPGVAIHRMGQLFPYHYAKERFHQNVAAIIPHNPTHLPAIWCFCSSPEYNEAVRRIDQKLNVTNATLVKVPFDLDRWTKVAQEKYPYGLPRPYTNDPTQWIFHGHPCGSVVWDEEGKWTAHGPLRTDHTVLQVAVARLLGYRWPAETTPSPSIAGSKERSRGNGTWGERGQGDGMELADEQREWVNRCEALLAHADDDGIVCIPAVRGEAPAADRLLNLLAAAYSANKTSSLAVDGEGVRAGEIGGKVAELLKSVDHGGRSLENWLRDGFFAQHCRLFQNRPFIWHIWDGLNDGFSALVNYHKLDQKLLETLIYTYLGDWITRQKQDIADKVDGAEGRLAAAESLKKRLELILEGEAPYDIFVRWKPIQDQPTGWNPDLNDGVRLNIRPFMTVPDVGKKGAGVLREAPRIDWNKDRGKDVESAPWFKMFGGERINDHHLRLDQKRSARESITRGSAR
jgi:hypothetical protein